MSRHILFFIGPPASGKGTQAELAAKYYSWPAISSGDLLRRLADLPKKYQAAIQSGHLVDDQIINDLLKRRLAQPDTKSGFILDGYPRNSSQFDYAYHHIITAEDKVRALEIKVSDEEVYRRLGGRRFCPHCGAGYHLIYKPSKREGICDYCSTKLEKRPDDKPQVITERLKLYHETMEPLKVLWQKRGELITINGEQDIAAVHQDVVASLAQWSGLSPQ